MTGKFLTISDELALHYEESGDGDIPILMLPGWTMSTKVFEHQLSHFADSQSYKFITFDPRAHGLSSKTEDGHFYEQHGRDLYDFIEALSLRNIVLGGWSFGTLTALSYINQFGSDRLSGFIMLDGPPRAAGKDNRLDWVTYSYSDVDKSQEFFTMGRLRDRERTNLEFANWMLENKADESIAQILEITNQTPDAAAALLNATSVFLDYRDDLIALEKRLSLLYVVREEQKEVVTRWTKQNTPSATVIAFGEHMMFWERPSEFNDVLTNYLKRIRNRKKIRQSESSR